MHLAERAFAEQLADGEEIPVPAAILEDDSGSADEAAAAMSCSASATDAAKGLSMTRAAPEASADEALLEVHVGGRGEHDEVEALREQLLRRSEDLGLGMILVACARRAGSLVEMPSIEKRGFAAMNGAWKMRPERP